MQLQVLDDAKPDCADPSGLGFKGCSGEEDCAASLRIVVSIQSVNQGECLKCISLHLSLRLRCLAILFTETAAVVSAPSTPCCLNEAVVTYIAFPGGSCRYSWQTRSC